MQIRSPLVRAAFNLSMILAVAGTASSLLAASPKKKDHATQKQKKPNLFERLLPQRTDRTKEKEIFGNFSRDYASFYACQDKDAEWYFRRFFEQMKNNLAASPDIRHISLKSKDLRKAMLANVKSPNPSVEQNFEAVADFGIEISKALIEARSMQPKPDFDLALGGANGLLAKIKRPDLLKIWNSSLLTKVPAAALRQRHCKTQVSAMDRERAQSDHGVIVRKAIPVNRYTVSSEPTPVAPPAPPLVDEAGEEDFISIDTVPTPVVATPAVVAPPVAVATPPVAPPVVQTPAPTPPSTTPVDDAAAQPQVTRASIQRWINSSEAELARARRSGNTRVVREIEGRLRGLRSDLRRTPN